MASFVKPGEMLYIDGKPVGKVTSMQISQPVAGPMTQELTIELHADMTRFQKSITLAIDALVEFEGSLEALLEKLIKETDPSYCPERCKCGLYQCRGRDPHDSGFGPFHVFALHPCNDLADPMQALLDAPEPNDGPYRTILDEDEPTSLEEFYRRKGISEKTRSVPGTFEKESTPTDDHDNATPTTT